MGVSEEVESDDSPLEASRKVLEGFSDKAWSVGGLEFEGASRVSSEAIGVVLGEVGSKEGVSGVGCGLFEGLCATSEGICEGSEDD